MFVGSNTGSIVILCVKLNVKFSGREQVSEGLACLHDVKIIKQYDKNIFGRYESEHGACEGMRTGHSNSRVRMGKMENGGFREAEVKGLEVAVRSQGNSYPIPGIRG